MSAQQRRGPWSQQEDAYLMSLVQNQGALNWVRISQLLGSRTPKQCRERYHQNLKPSLNHEPITPEEGHQIELLVGQLGKRWAEIARRLRNRSDNAVKNWWNGSMNRRRRLVRKRVPGTYDDMQDRHHYPRPPLQLPSITSYSSGPRYSPALAPLHIHPYIASSGLPSPSTPSPGTDSADGAPSLMSDNGSCYSTSPRTAGIPTSPMDLPPLRNLDGSSPTNLTFGVDSKLPPIYAKQDLSRLPSLRDCVDSHQQLMTAPNSPHENAISPSSPTFAPGREESKDTRMNLSSLLS